jgi:hypothetical protein
MNNRDRDKRGIQRERKRNVSKKSDGLRKRELGIQGEGGER